MNQFGRVYHLHRLLSARRPRSFAELEEAMECKRTTLRRTLTFLRDGLHAPVIYDREHGGYRYDGESRYELPGLWFSAAELSALLILDEVVEQHPVGLLSEALKPVRARIELLLRKSGAGLPDWRSRLRLLRMAARGAGGNFGTVADAVARRHRLRIDYHARSNDHMLPPREVSPQRLTLYRDNWYLDAWCHTRNDLRIFALDRIVAAEVLTTVAEEVAPTVLDETLATSYGIFAGKPTALAVLQFSAHAARWVADETWHPEQQDVRHEDGSLVRRLPYHRSEELILDVLRHGPDVEVLEPAELREVVVEKLRLALKCYTSGSERAA